MFMSDDSDQVKLTRTLSMKGVVFFSIHQDSTLVGVIKSGPDEG